MRLLSTSLLILLTYTLERAGCVTQCSSGQYVAPNSNPKTYSANLDSNTGVGYLMKDTVFTFSCCGVIKSWQFYGGTGVSGTIEFQVWRQVFWTSYRLVGENTRGFTTSEGSSQQVITYNVPVAEQISIQAGDKIGWRTAGKDIITYRRSSGGDDDDSDEAGTTELNNNILKSSMPDVVVGQTYTWPISKTTGRTYAMKANVDAGSAPSFQGSSSITINDATLVGTSVYTPTVVDANTYDTITFSDGGVPSVYFSVDGTTGAVITQSTMAIGVYSVRIRGTDPCGLQATMDLSVTVISANQAPLLGDVPFSVSLHEDTTTEVLLHTMAVSDADNDSVSCNIISGGSSHFQLKLNSSVSAYSFYTVGGSTFSYLTTPTYYITISCTDGTDTTTGNGTVNIQPNQPPSFDNLPSTANVSAKTSLTGTSVYHVYASDVDDVILTFNFTCSPLPCPFEISSAGEITASTDLKYQKTTTYELNITVEDTHSVVGPSTLVVYLTDINTPPFFTNLPQTVNVQENTLPGHSVLTVLYSDADVNDTVAIQLQANQTNTLVFFMMNETDSTVYTTTSPVDFESLSDKYFTLNITIDDGIDSVTSSLTINIVDENEAPVLLTPRYFVTTIEGKQTTHIPVISYAIQDPEGSNNFSFSITSGVNSDRYLIDPTKGSLSFSKDVYVNETTTDVITVSIADEANMTTNATVEIVLVNVNHQPYFDNLPTSINIQEDTPTGSNVYVISVSDEDFEDTVVVGVSSMSSGAASVFTFNATVNTLILRPGMTLNYEHIPEFNITFEASDGTNITYATLTLHLIDINESPTFTASTFYITIDEGKNGESISHPTFTYIDPDGEDNSTYSLIQGDYSDYFSINSVSGQLSYAVDDILKKVTSSFLLGVKLTDSFGATDIANVSIIINHVNTLPYVTNLPTSLHVPETQAVGSLIYIVMFEDPDDADVHNFFFTFQPPEQNSKLSFSANGTQIQVSLNSALDYESCNSVNISFGIHDGYNQSEAYWLYMVIDDVNEAPVFLSNEYIVTTPEQKAGGHVAGPFTYLDEDTADTAQFSIVSGTGAGYLTIDPSNGNISFAVDYDSDNPSLHSQLSIILRVTDNGGLSGTTTVKVDVEDVNDNAPIFDSSSYLRTAYGDTLIGSTLLQVNATDSDTGSNAKITYILEQVPSLFEISNNGNIILLSSLSGYSPGTVLNFTVVARDSGIPQLSSSARVEVIIAEGNAGQTQQLAESDSIEDSIKKPEYFGLLIASGVLLFSLLTVGVCLCHKAYKGSGPRKGKWNTNGAVETSNTSNQTPKTTGNGNGRQLKRSVSSNPTIRKPQMKRVASDDPNIYRNHGRDSIISVRPSRIITPSDIEFAPEHRSSFSSVSGGSSLTQFASHATRPPTSYTDIFFRESDPTRKLSRPYIEY